MISVIIPLYNAKAYICEAVLSAIRQDTEKEIIVIDDCSTDGSMEYLKDWLKKNPDIAVNCPVRLFENEENLGVANTRNKGVTLANGEYIAFLDADDRFVEEKLVRQLARLKETGACLCNTARVLIQPDGTPTDVIIHTPEKITLSDMEHTNLINCSSVLAKRETMLAFPMEHSEVHEDYLTWIRLLKQEDFVVGIDEPLLEYRLSEKGKSRNKLKSAYMTYRTYRLAGYSVRKSGRMMVDYMINGLKKYAVH